MLFEFTEEEVLIRDTARKMAAEIVAPLAPALVVRQTVTSVRTGTVHRGCLRHPNDIASTAVPASTSSSALLCFAPVVNRTGTSSTC